MNRIDAAFERLRASGRKGLIAYLTAGDPSLEVTEALVSEMARRGVDMVELGVPFSDPLADGPAIQAASERALRSGATLGDVLDLAGRLRAKMELPLMIMTYYNPVHTYGLPEFVEAASRSGIDGVIVPDLPLEESHELWQVLEEAGIHFIFFLAPTSSAERIAETVARARGFIYCVSVAGVTGVRDEIPESARELLRRVRARTDLPLALGFGISRPDQVASLAEDADAVVIGSAIVNLVAKGGAREEIVRRVGEFIQDFRTRKV